MLARPWDSRVGASAAALDIERREMTLIPHSDLDGEYVPSPVERIRKRVAGYEASGASTAEHWKAGPVVILTSVGVISSTRRHAHGV